MLCKGGLCLRFCLCLGQCVLAREASACSFKSVVIVWAAQSCMIRCLQPRLAFKFFIAAFLCAVGSRYVGLPAQGNFRVQHLLPASQFSTASWNPALACERHLCLRGTSSSRRNLAPAMRVGSEGELQPGNTGLASLAWIWPIEFIPLKRESLLLCCRCH